MIELINMKKIVVADHSSPTHWFKGIFTEKSVETVFDTLRSEIDNTIPCKIDKKTYRDVTHDEFEIDVQKMKNGTASYMECEFGDNVFMIKRVTGRRFDILAMYSPDDVQKIFDKKRAVAGIEWSENLEKNPSVYAGGKGRVINFDFVKRIKDAL